MSDDNDATDVELVISGISPARDGQSERHRLEAPVRLKMLGIHEGVPGAYHVGHQPVRQVDFALAVEMAKVRQLDRIADLLERLVAQSDDRGRRS